MPAMGRLPEAQDGHDEGDDGCRPRGEPYDQGDGPQARSRRRSAVARDSPGEPVLPGVFPRLAYYERLIAAFGTEIAVARSSNYKVQNQVLPRPFIKSYHPTATIARNYEQGRYLSGIAIFSVCAQLFSFRIFGVVRAYDPDLRTFIDCELAEGGGEKGAYQGRVPPSGCGLFALKRSLDHR